MECISLNTVIITLSMRSPCTFAAWIILPESSYYLVHNALSIRQHVLRNKASAVGV